MRLQRCARHGGATRLRNWQCTGLMGLWASGQVHGGLGRGNTTNGSVGRGWVKAERGQVVRH
jgi:hypothetical protein